MSPETPDMPGRLNQTLAAADPLPAELRAALIKVRADGAH